VRSVRPDEFVDDWRDGFYNGHYDWPACLAVLGEVAARTVLDVHAGSGLHSDKLLARGVPFIGLDQRYRGRFPS